MQPTIFTYLDSIINTKRYVDAIKQEDHQYSSFMCNRWVSMYSNTAAEIINDSANKYWSQMMHPQDHYEFMLNLLPTYPRRKISYIKKVKEETSKDQEEKDNTDALLAKRMELSTREIKQYKCLVD